MNLYNNAKYNDDLKYVAELDLPWEKLKNTSILISGGTGLVGSFVVDVIMYKNRNDSLNCKINLICRNRKKAEKRFAHSSGYNELRIISGDINYMSDFDIEKVDYVMHLASNTHPVAYATDPVGTILTNVIGTMNMLDIAVKYNARRFVFASSVEIYGENLGDKEKFDESYCGYIDCNTLRAGYPESKRCGEALCQAYIKQKNLDVVIPRITRSYGPTLLETDTKALSQFLHKGLIGEDIVLKSKGTQYYSYTYVSDAVSGLLTVMLNGKCGEAYNIADESSDVMLRDLAQIVADYSNRKVVFDLPDETESSGFSKATLARMDNKKICSELGWNARYSITDGIFRTMDIIKNIRDEQNSFE